MADHVFLLQRRVKVQAVYLFVAAGLIMINFLVMVLMQDLLVKGELRESTLTDQKKESQIAHYQDMQAVYERQGRKMHDYKNQIRTMQVLLKEGDVQAAALAERLTESMHGVGLMNVRAVVDKYGGDFAIFCDQEKFQAVVMI